LVSFSANQKPPLHYIDRIEETDLTTLNLDQHSNLIITMSLTWGNWKKWSGKVPIFIKEKRILANHIACSYYSFLIKTIMNIQDKIDIIKKKNAITPKSFWNA